MSLGMEPEDSRVRVFVTGSEFDGSLGFTDAIRPDERCHTPGFELAAELLEDAVATCEERVTASGVGYEEVVGTIGLHGVWKERCYRHAVLRIGAVWHAEPRAVLLRTVHAREVGFLLSARGRVRVPTPVSVAGVCGLGGLLFEIGTSGGWKPYNGVVKLRGDI